MALQASTETQDAVRKTFGLTPSAREAAFLPFSVLFWKWDELKDVNLGAEPTIADPDSLGSVWPEYIEGNREKELLLTLYGSENSWASEKDILKVKTKMTLVSGLGFQLEVLEVRALNADERTELREQCDSLNLARSCNVLGK